MTSTAFGKIVFIADLRPLSASDDSTKLSLIPEIRSVDLKNSDYLT